MTRLKLRAEEKKALLNRLKRAEGQMRGVQRMIQEERDCEAILQQLAAVRSALHTASLSLARSYATACLSDARDTETAAQVIDTLLHAMGKLS